MQLMCEGYACVWSTRTRFHLHSVCSYLYTTGGSTHIRARHLPNAPIRSSALVVQKSAGCSLSREGIQVHHPVVVVRTVERHSAG